jgi:inner membrane transporter RhtA
VTVRLRRASRAEAPALALVGMGALSVQFGAALATKLFSRVGPTGAVTLRLVGAAVVLGLLRIAWPGRLARPGRRSDLGVAVAFGLVLAAMNLSFYESIDRIPLGVAVTLEFWGPLAVALAWSRRWLDGLWAAAAGAGVVLLASGGGHHLDPAGVALALLAGLFWIGYILLSRAAGRRFAGLDGLTLAMVFGAFAILPFGLASHPGRLVQGDVLLLGATVAVLSSALPYSLELVALRRVSPRAFGVMLSLDPAVAAAAGVVVLGQRLTLVEWVALALVVGANLGNSLMGRPEVVATTP